MKNESPLLKLYHKDGTKTVIASMISILIGLLVGSIVVLIIGATNGNITMKGGWEGVQMVLFGVFSTGRDAAGLLRTAIRDDNPVIIFEHKALYATKCDVPDDPDFMLPFGKADIKREGTDVTIVANLLYVNRALEAADDDEPQE